MLVAIKVKTIAKVNYAVVDSLIYLDAERCNISHCLGNMCRKKFFNANSELGVQPFCVYDEVIVIS
jgi:hypothetical protein